MTWRVLSQEEKSATHWLEKYHHGILWNSGDIPYHRLQKILEICSQGVKKVFVKGEQKARWLADLLPNILDYQHGTGHGIGAYLNVHELPTMISWRPYPDDPGVQIGMFLSNEPGYYENEHFGIRLENIEMIVKSNTKYNRLNREFLTFDTITLVPIQSKLLNTSILTDDEIRFLNNYHEKCYKTLYPYLQDPENIQTLHWLKKETQTVEK